jgi:hypothetical protein
MHSIPVNAHPLRHIDNNFVPQLSVLGIKYVHFFLLMLLLPQSYRHRCRPGTITTNEKNNNKIVRIKKKKKNKSGPRTGLKQVVHRHESHWNILLMLRGT